jgi:hypothetical protein
VSRTIWKYEIEVTDRQEIELPLGAEFLPFVAQQPGQRAHMLTLWAYVPRVEDDRMQKVPVYVVGTGNSIPDEVGQHGYLGSVQSGVFVWHVFKGDW